MLYLNCYQSPINIQASTDLTLTSVVFELDLKIFTNEKFGNLTLTSVVFE